MDEEPSATWVELEHHGFERHGEGGAEYRTGMASPSGWPYILDRYAAATESLHRVSDPAAGQSFLVRCIRSAIPL